MLTMVNSFAVYMFVSLHIFFYQIKMLVQVKSLIVPILKRKPFSWQAKIQASALQTFANVFVKVLVK